MKRFWLFFFLSAYSFAQINNARMLSGVNAQTGVSYTFVAQDATRLTTFANSNPVAVVLPSGLTQNFGAGTMFSVQNLGPGTVTITCSGCLIFASNSSGSATLPLLAGQGADIYGSAGANYSAVLGSGASNGAVQAGLQNLAAFYPNAGTNAVIGPTTSLQYGANGVVQIPQDLQVGGNYSGGQAIFLTPDINGVCAFYGGLGSNYDQISDLNGQLMWNPLGSGGPCQQALVYLPLPTGTNPQNGWVPCWNNSGLAFQLNAPCAFPSASVTNAGSFTNLVMNEYLQTSINGGSASTEFHTVQSGNYSTDGVAGALIVPSTATVHQINGLAGYIQDLCNGSGGTVCNSVGLYGQVRDGTSTNGAAMWGVNTVLQTGSSSTNAHMTGIENDINVTTGSSPASIFGYQVNGTGNGTMPAAYAPGANPVLVGGAAAFAIIAPHWIGGGGYRWPIGYMTFRGSVNGAGLQLDAGCAPSEVPCGSNTITQTGYDGSNVAHTITYAADNLGNMDLTPAAGQSVVDSGPMSATIFNATGTGAGTQSYVQGSALSVCGSGNCVPVNSVGFDAQSSEPATPIVFDLPSAALPTLDYVWCAGGATTTSGVSHSAITPCIISAPQILTSDQSTTNTSPGVSKFTWGALPANTNYTVACQGMYTQATAAGGIGFSVAGTVNAPTRLDAWANIGTAQAPVSFTYADAVNITTTTVTALSANATPGAITTRYPWELYGTIQVGASPSTFNIYVYTGNASDAVTLKAGSKCVLTQAY